MDAYEFNHRLQTLTARDIEQIAAAIRAELDSVEGEVAWWRATIEVTGALRRNRRSRQASIAAHRAATMVVEAARAAGLEGDEHRDAVTAVARAAAEAARLLVAEGALVGVAGETLLHPWQLVAA
jgi:citrate lyase beta subunit